MKRTVSFIAKEEGASLVELLVAMAIVIIVVTMNTGTIDMIVKQSRQQTQSVASAMDRLVGLEMLRADAELAGFGLPWSFQGAISYSEAAGASQGAYNDSPSNPPRPVLTGNNTGYNGSDYLVIKSTAVGFSDTSQKWSHLSNGSAAARMWGTAKDLAVNERVVVIWPSASGGFDRQLVMNGTAFSTSVSDSAGTIPVNFRPPSSAASYIVYGVDPAANLRMPFNRADYYVARPDPMPQGCAPGTGILYKSTVSHTDGSTANPLPLLDCVADMQVVFRLDANLDGIIDTESNNISALTAQNVRQQVKEMRIYILSHEGERDGMFSYQGGSTVTVGEFGLGRNIDLSVIAGSGWRNYRWKLSSLVIRTKNILN